MDKEGKYRQIANNKKAYHDYFIEETYQAGLELFGTEVKSLRAGKCNLKDSYIRIEKGEAFIHSMHISPYEHGNMQNKDPLRTRKLLLHKKEINTLFAGVKKDGFSIVPLRIYFAGSLVKIDIALARGKKLYDKRDTIAKKDQERALQQELKNRNLRF